MFRVGRYFVFALLPLVVVAVGCGSAEDASPDDSAGADTTNSATSAEALSAKKVICDGICSGPPTLACLDVGLVFGLFCAVGGEAACIVECSSHKGGPPIRPSQNVAQACLNKIGLGHANCLEHNNSDQICKVTWGNSTDPGWAEVTYGNPADGKDKAHIYVSYGIGSGCGGCGTKGANHHSNGYFKTDC
jgi:hypothetical protein